MAVFEIAKSVGGSTIGLAGGSSSAILSSNVTDLVIGALSGDGRISQAYDHLLLRTYVDVDGASFIAGMYCMINNTTSGSNYSETRVTSPGPATSKKTGENYFRAWGHATGASSPALTHGVTDCWFINYSSDNTAGCKVILSETGTNYDSTSLDNSTIALDGGIWNPSSVAGITQMEIGLLSGTNILAGSSFTLIGVTGA